jgi:uncharacterized protein YggE
MLARPLALLVLTLGFPLAAYADEPARPYIETTGESSASAKPDIAVVTIGVQSVAEAAQAALADNSKATQGVIDAVKSAGVDAKDIQTSDFSIWPRMSIPGKNDTKPPAIVGYTVANRVTVTEHDIARLGDVLDKAVSAGANSINGVQFGVTDASKLLDEARKAAFADARRKAEIYAAEAGVKLGPLIELDETGAPAPMMYRHAAVAPASIAAAPIEAGESKLTVSVRARFEIAPASKP